MNHLIELHLHLDGSLRPETVWELSKEQGIKLPAGSLDEVRHQMRVPENCKTLEEYFQFKRLSVAKTMLLKNGNTPALVARQLGYPNVQYFSLIFKKITGIAPCEYPYAQN